jgi:hypothetical protein
MLPLWASCQDRQLTRTRRGDSYRPRIFRLGDPLEQAAWHALRAELEGHLRLHDTFEQQLFGLARCRNPKTSFTRHALEQEATRSSVRNRELEEREELVQVKARLDAVAGASRAPVFMFRVFAGCGEPPARSLRRPVVIAA